MNNLTEMIYMVQITLHKTCEDRDEWRRLTKKEESVATIDDDDGLWNGFRAGQVEGLPE